MTPSLIPIFNETLSQIPDVGMSSSVLDNWKDIPGVLGSGSDYTVFLDFLGIASIDMGYTGEYGTYHSIYDSFDWMSKEIDPEFAYHQKMAQIWGLLALKLSETDHLPLCYSVYAKHLGDYSQTIKRFAEANHLTLKYDDLLNAIDQLASAADLIKAQTPDDELNHRLYLAERQFLNPDGLPGRKWFKHVIQAPGIHQGYDAEVFPAVMDAIREKDVQIAQEQLDIISKRITSVAEFLLGSQDINLLQQ